MKIVLRPLDLDPQVVLGWPYSRMLDRQLLEFRRVKRWAAEFCQELAGEFEV